LVPLQVDSDGRPHGGGFWYDSSFHGDAGMDSGNPTSTIDPLVKVNDPQMANIFSLGNDELMMN
jgi:hypothetical protein